MYGSTDWEYRDYVGSAMLTAYVAISNLPLTEGIYNSRVVFLNAIALTAMAFAVERNEGLFERAYSAGITYPLCACLIHVLIGASVTDFIFAFTLHASVILMAQVTVLLIVVFAIFQVYVSLHVSCMCYRHGYRLKWREVFSCTD